MEEQPPIKFYYASLQLETDQEDIPCVEFNSFDDFVEYYTDVLFATHDSQGVFIARQPIAYIVSMKDEVFVTSDINSMMNFVFFTYSFNNIGNDEEKNNIHIHECESFEEAYIEALMMQEISPICYRNDEK